MGTASNPYSPDTVKTEMFFGRRRLVSELMSGLDASKSYAICGGRRMGKTMLLKYVQSCRVDRGDCAYYDLKGHLLSVQKPVDLLVGMQTSIASLVKGDLAATLLLSLSAVESFEHVLAKVISALPTGQLAILLDESDAILERSWGRDLFSYLRSLVSNSSVSGRFAVVLTGGRQLRELARLGGSPFNVATWCYLEPFEYDDTFALASEPTKCEVSLELVERLHQYSGGHPFIAQFLLHDMVDDPRGISLGLLATAEAKFNSTQSFHMRSWWGDLTNDDRALYEYLASVRSAVSLASCSRVVGRTAQESMEGLISYGLARFCTGSGSYAANCQAFETWFRETAPTARDVPAGAALVRVVSPETPHTNVMHLRQTIRELREYIWWVDPHFGTRVFEELNSEVDPGRVHQIRILSRSDTVSSKAKREYERFLQEMENRGIDVEWRAYVKGSIKVHDRYLLGANAVYNVPPVNSIYEGAYAEILPSKQRPPFEEWWDKGTPVR